MSVSVRAARSAHCATSLCRGRGPTRWRSGSATRPATRRPPRRSRLPLRFDDLPPGVAFAASEGSGLPDWIRADVSDQHSGPRRRRAPLPAARLRLLGRAAVEAAAPAGGGSAGRPGAGLAGRGHLSVPGGRRRRRRQRGDDHPPCRRHRDGPAQARAGGRREGRAGRQGPAPDEARRGSSPASAGAGGAGPASPSRSAPPRSSAAACSTRPAPAWPGGGSGSSPAPHAGRSRAPR